MALEIIMETSVLPKVQGNNIRSNLVLECFQMVCSKKYHTMTIGSSYGEKKITYKTKQKISIIANDAENAHRTEYTVSPLQLFIRNQ